ncbi:MarR family winged helix-turn-helix transcriptional regulator [Zafaria cholistanensis]|nr:MarR family transcriptional regulator [Zafaria cholistanensis]
MSGVERDDATAGAGVPEPVEPDRLAAELRVAIMRASRRLRTEASGELLKPAQYSVLGALQQGSRTIGQLARGEMVAAPSMTRIVQHLEDAGWTSRQPHPDDARQVVVSITGAGREILQRAQAHRTAWLARRLGELDAADRRILARAAELLQGMCSE